MQSPSPGSTFSSSSATFTWSPGSASVYLLLVGSSQNGSDIYNSGQVTVLSKTVSNIPTDGRSIYVTLGSHTYTDAICYSNARTDTNADSDASRYTNFHTDSYAYVNANTDPNYQSFGVTYVGESRKQRYLYGFGLHN